MFWRESNSVKVRRIVSDIKVKGCCLLYRGLGTAIGHLLAGRDRLLRKRYPAWVSLREGSHTAFHTANACPNQQCGPQSLATRRRNFKLTKQSIVPRWCSVSNRNKRLWPKPKFFHLVIYSSGHATSFPRDRETALSRLFRSSSRPAAFTCDFVSLMIFTVARTSSGVFR